jgi:hypothetical protein
MYLQEHGKSRGVDSMAFWRQLCNTRSPRVRWVDQSFEVYEIGSARMGRCCGHSDAGGLPAKVFVDKYFLHNAQMEFRRQVHQFCRVAIWLRGRAGIDISVWL